jgi:hypothetical protein
MEVLLAIVLMALGFTAILGGMFTSARVAQVNQRNTKAGLALQSLAEAIVQPALANKPSTYIPCAGFDGDPSDVTGDEYKDAMQNTPPAAGELVQQGWTWRVSKIRYLAGFQPISSAEPDIRRPTYRSQQSCRDLLPSNNGRDEGLQEITIELTTPTSWADEQQITRQIVVTKRDRGCPPYPFVNADTGPC